MGSWTSWAATETTAAYREGAARDRHVVRSGDEDDVAEVGLVGQLVQRLEEIAPGRPQAHVADVHPVLDRPLQAAGEDRPAPAQARAEHADAVQLAVGSQRADDPGAGGSVAKRVLVRLGVDRPARRPFDGDVALDVADRGMRGVDAAVDDGDLDTFPGAAAPRPLAA